MTKITVVYPSGLTRELLRDMERKGNTDVEIANHCGVTRQAVFEARKRWRLPRIYEAPKSLPHGPLKSIGIRLPECLIEEIDRAITFKLSKSMQSRSGLISAILEEHFAKVRQTES